GDTDQYIKAVKTVELQDEKLVGYRDQAIRFYSERSDLFQRLSTWFQNPTVGFRKAQNIPPIYQARMAIEQMDQAMHKLSDRMNSIEDKLLGEISTYCGTKGLR
ncbi:MAG: hypothetical protein VKJ24_10595, partial [Synechococcales bacterium]|nr:hypothetical protein [Synechococcales bacterium]